MSTALHCAATGGHLPALQLLLHRGADIEVKDNVRQTNPYGRDRYIHIVHVYVCIYVCMYVCVYVYNMYVCMCVDTYILF